MGDVQEAEGSEHAKHGTIDRLTIAKIIHRTVLAGQLQYVSIALPLTKSSQGAVERQFVVAAGVPLDDKLLQKVCTAWGPFPCLGLPFCWKLSASVHTLTLALRLCRCLLPQVAKVLKRYAKSKQGSLRGQPASGWCAVYLHAEEQPAYCRFSRQSPMLPPRPEPWASLWRSCLPWMYSLGLLPGRAQACRR